MKRLLTENFLSSMLNIMETLRDAYGPPGGAQARTAFNYTHAKVNYQSQMEELTDPVLEYVKVCLEGLCLDGSLPDEIAGLRRGLLTQVYHYLLICLFV